MKNSRSALGFSVMTVVPLLQLGTEFLGTGDRGRTLSKLAVTLIGLPILLWGSSRGLRWAAGRRSGPLWLLAGGMLSAGALYALLLEAMHLASAPFPILRPAMSVSTISALRIGFAMGLTNFGLWALAFVFGLVHGFGFASVLADLGLPREALLLALVAFNIGVEVGQLVIVGHPEAPAHHCDRHGQPG